MKVIVSHDVDHLYPSDHHFRDLYFPKLYARSFLEWMKGQCTPGEFFRRCLLPFRRRLHHIPELLAYDRSLGIPSTFFFGMDNGLGMMYRRERAKPIMDELTEQGVDIGVHGIHFQELSEIRKEYDAFSALTGRKDFGIRMHYVRRTEDTFPHLARAGYLFDSTQFDKTQQTLAAPYKVGGLWEFPLHIMEGYAVPPGKLEEGKQKTLRLLEKAEAEGLPYLVILFHDVYFDEALYREYTAWYRWLTELLTAKKLEFVNFRTAIRELEEDAKNGDSNRK